jgi:hypothetical protein
MRLFTMLMWISFFIGVATAIAAVMLIDPAYSDWRCVEYSPVDGQCVALVDPRRTP